MKCVELNNTRGRRRGVFLLSMRKETVEERHKAEVGGRPCLYCVHGGTCGQSRKSVRTVQLHVTGWWRGEKGRREGRKEGGKEGRGERRERR